MKKAKELSPLGRQILKVVNKIDRNTRALAKVVSAADWLDNWAERSKILEDAEFAILQERRNLRSEFEELWKQQPKGNE